MSSTILFFSFPFPPPPNIKQGYSIQVANGVWSQTGWGILSSFVNVLVTDYAAVAAQLDFSGQNSAAIQAINQWIDQETQGIIPAMLDTLAPSTELVLANAIYFKAGWANPFSPANTSNDIFYVNGAVSTPVPMMHNQIDPTVGGIGGDYDVLELPYVSSGASSGFAMDIFLPHARDGIAAVEKEILADSSAQWENLLSPVSVQLSLPKFQFGAKFNPAAMQSALSALGMTDAFTPAADFSGIDGGGELFISQILHQTHVEVDELGTIAVAVTVVEGVGAAAVITAAPMVFTVDHPFFFLIRDIDTGAVVFMGRVEDPTAH